MTEELETAGLGVKIEIDRALAAKVEKALAREGYLRLRSDLAMLFHAVVKAARIPGDAAVVLTVEPGDGGDADAHAVHLRVKEDGDYRITVYLDAFINEGDYLLQLLAHELEHIRQFASGDLVTYEMQGYDWAEWICSGHEAVSDGLDAAGLPQYRLLLPVRQWLGEPYYYEVVDVSQRQLETQAWCAEGFLARILAKLAENYGSGRAKLIRLRGGRAERIGSDEVPWERRAEQAEKRLPKKVLAMPGVRDALDRALAALAEAA